MDADLSPQATLQRLLQADTAAQERVHQAEEQAQALVAQAQEEAEALVEQAREEAQNEAHTLRQSAAETDDTPAPDHAARTDTNQAYRSDPEALRQRTEPHMQQTADWLVAWVTGEDRAR